MIQSNNRVLGTLASLSRKLATGETTAVELVETSLERIFAIDGEGDKVFVKVHGKSARSVAQAMDILRKSDLAPSQFAGIPISVKDLFDLSGETTTAGSTIFRHAPSASTDAPAIARLRAAGFIVVGRTNMSEFAYSGVGLNPHYGTPAAPFDRAKRRIPGGSSSGAAVSVADGMAAVGIGTDTGGSCRIPAALCGLIGFKPTAILVPCSGVVPLSPTLDSIGSLALSVNCCRVIHGVMSGLFSTLPTKLDVKRLRIAVPQTYVLDGMDAYVGELFERTLGRLSTAGALVEHVEFSELADVVSMNAKGGVAAAESYAFHRSLLELHADKYDPRVKARILMGREQSAADYLDLLKLRANFVARMRRLAAPFDAFAFPTVPIRAPTIEELETNDESFTRVNRLMLRNSAVVNIMDGCAISLPMHISGEAPAGLTLATIGGRDDDLFAVAQAVETMLTASVRH